MLLSSVLSWRVSHIVAAYPTHIIHYRHHNHHLSLSREDRWGTTDDFITSFLHFSVLHCPLGLGELQAYPFLEVICPPLLLSALSSSPFHCALQDAIGQT